VQGGAPAKPVNKTTSLEPTAPAKPARKTKPAEAGGFSTPHGSAASKFPRNTMRRGI